LEIQNRFALHKGISPLDTDKIPYCDYMEMIDIWVEEIKHQNAERQKQIEENKRHQSQMRNNQSMPKMPSSRLK
jgi:hypothetical protein